MTTPTPGSLADLLMALGAPYMGEPGTPAPTDTPAAPKEPLTDEQKQQLEQLRTFLAPLLAPPQPSGPTWGGEGGLAYGGPGAVQMRDSVLVK